MMGSDSGRERDAVVEIEKFISTTIKRKRNYLKGMLKKAASGVLALLPNLRAHRLAALRGVRAHVL
jgi:hypothetical protein